MRLSCPACQAETSLDVLIGREADARALGELLAANLPLGGLVVSYLALFRPPKRRLSIARALGLFAELQADVQRGAINRKGRDWPAPAAVWRAAIEQVLAARDRGTLTTPLTSHGYLYEVVAGLADKAEGLAEREAEAARRSRGHVAEPQAVAVAVAVAGLLLQRRSSTRVASVGPRRVQCRAAAAIRTCRRRPLSWGPQRSPVGRPMGGRLAFRKR